MASTSLISHLGFGSKKILSSARGRGDHLDYLSVRIDLNSPEPVKMIPMMGTNFKPLSISDWWSGEAVFVHNSTNISREKIVSDIANKMGGAHVDSKIPRYFEALYAGGFTLGVTGNLTFDGPAPFEQGVLQHAKNGHLALIRQFGHEFLTTVRQSGW
ncbi:MAG: hypothetical protein WBO10_03530 [Pyrinomonadaceae bacterium]